MISGQNIERLQKEPNWVLQSICPGYNRNYEGNLHNSAWGNVHQDFIRLKFFVGQCFYLLKYKFLTRLESYKEGIQATNDGEKRGYRRYTNFAVERHFRSSAPGNMTILSLSFISQWKNTYLLNCLWWETCNTLLQWYIYVIVKNPKTVWP